MTDAKYLADIASASSHATLQPLEVLSAMVTGDKVILNDLTINGVHEQGVELERATSDVSTTTGVLHTALGDFFSKFRPPFPVYWDVADFPEVRKISAAFRKTSVDFAYGTIKDINWDNPNNSLSGGGVGYYYVGQADTRRKAFYADMLRVGMGLTSRHHWIDLRTPLLVRGKYNIWICYVQEGGNLPANVYFDGQQTSRTFNFATTRPAGSDGELLALGWKRYTYPDSTSTFMAGKLVGTVDVTTTDRHIIRIEAGPSAGTRQTTNNLDMIHFIPVDLPS